MYRNVLVFVVVILAIGCSSDAEVDRELEECAEQENVECCGDSQCGDGEFCNAGTCEGEFGGCSGGQIRFNTIVDSNEPFGGPITNTCIDELTADECSETTIDGRCGCYDQKIAAEMAEGYQVCASSEAGLSCEDDGTEITSLSCRQSG